MSSGTRCKIKLSLIIAMVPFCHGQLEDGFPRIPLKMAEWKAKVKPITSEWWHHQNAASNEDMTLVAEHTVDSQVQEADKVYVKHMTRQNEVPENWKNISRTAIMSEGHAPKVVVPGDWDDGRTWDRRYGTGPNPDDSVHIVDKTSDPEDVADKMVDNLFDRILKKLSFHRTGLDKTMFGKPGHLTIRPGRHVVPTMDNAWTMRTSLRYHPLTHWPVPSARFQSSMKPMSLDESKAELTESIAVLQASIDQLERQSHLDRIKQQPNNSFGGRNTTKDQEIARLQNEIKETEFTFQSRTEQTPLESQKRQLFESIAVLEASMEELKGRNISFRRTSDQKESRLMASKYKSGAQGGAFSGGVTAAVTAFVLGGPVGWAAGGGALLGATVGYFAGAVSYDEDQAFNAGMAAGAGGGLIVGNKYSQNPKSPRR